MASLPTIIRPDSTLYNPSFEPPTSPRPIKGRKSLAQLGYNPFGDPAWGQQIQPTKRSMNFRLQKMVLSNIGPDVLVKLGEYGFNCHMIVLQCYAEIFRQFLHEKAVIIPRDLICASAFDMIYKWMINDNPLLSRDGIIELFKAAQYLSIKELENHLWYCIESGGHMAEEHAFRVYLEARYFRLEMLENLMLARVRKFFLAFVASKEFVDFDHEQLCQIISLNTIGVNSEVELFMCTVRWLNYNWEERQAYIPAICERIRFGLMHPQFITKLRCAIKPVEMERVYTHPVVNKCIDEGLRYSIMQRYYDNHPEFFRSWLDEERKTVINERKWIFDRGCSYHHRSWCKSAHDLDYDTFLKYLREVREVGVWHRYMLEWANEGDQSKGGGFCESCRGSRKT